MLELIRNKMHGIFAWVMLISIAVVFIFWGSIGLRLGASNYIDVNGEKIYQQDIARFKSVYPNADLVQVTLGVQELNNIGFAYSSKQVDNIIKSSPMFQVDGKFSKELYDRYLSTNIGLLESLRTGVVYNSLTNQMYYALQTAQVSFPSNTELYYKLMDQKRNVSVLTINSDKFVSDVTVSDQELQNFYNANKSNYIEPAKVKLEYIKLHYPDIVKKIRLTNEELKKYYEANLEQFIQPGQKKIAQLVIAKNSKEAKDNLDKIVLSLGDNQSVKNFAELAKKYSTDKLTATKNGDAGWFQVGDMGYPELDDALAKLKKVGEISDVITYDDNWYILQLTDIQKSEQSPFKEVKSDIEITLAEQRANTIYSELKDQLERKSYEIADNLEIVGEELGLVVNKTNWINTNGYVNANLEQDNLITNPKVIETAFSEDVLDNRNNSALIELDSESAIVIRVADHQAESINSFEDVKDSVKESVVKAKAASRAREYAENLWNEFINNTVSIKKLESYAKNKYVKFTKSKNVSYFDTFYATQDGNIKQELAYAFELPKPNKDYPLQAKLLKLDNGDQSILAVDMVQLGEYTKASDQQKQQTANQLKYFMFMRDNANFYNRLYANSKVESYM